MKKNLEINDVKEDKKIKLNIDIHLNEMVLTLFIKDKNLLLNVEYQKKIIINIDSNFEEIIYDFYEEYVELKSIEFYWGDKIKDMSIIDIDIDLDVDEL